MVSIANVIFSSTMFIKWTPFNSTKTASSGFIQFYVKSLIMKKSLAKLNTATNSKCHLIPTSLRKIYHVILIYCNCMQISKWNRFWYQILFHHHVKNSWKSRLHVIKLHDTVLFLNDVSRIKKNHFWLYLKRSWSGICNTHPQIVQR